MVDIIEYHKAEGSVSKILSGKSSARGITHGYRGRWKSARRRFL